MIEKVVPMPFAGRYVSGWMYRTSRWVSEHKWKATLIGVGCIVAPLIYEAEVSHAGHVVSPEVANHLEYEFKRTAIWKQLVKRLREFSNKIVNKSIESDNNDSSDNKILNNVTDTTHAAETSNVDDIEIVNNAEIIKAMNCNNDERSANNKLSIENARVLLAETTDPSQRAELQALIAKENEEMNKSKNSTLIVRRGQLDARMPFWTVRNSERNWNILSRDLQQQKDNYWYRMERSKDDDYGRNTYSDENNISNNS